jgi:hypothetical protein
VATAPMHRLNSPMVMPAVPGRVRA